MDWKELYIHAREWAINHRGMTIAMANVYAKWYAANYPEGMKAHSEAFEYWQSKQIKVKKHQPSV